MFDTREDAARRLAEAVAAKAPEAPVVLALPRGGVPLAAIVARRLKAPLDLVLVRKIGMPRNPEFAAGAIVDGAAPAIRWNREALDRAGLSPADFEPEIARLKSEIDRRRTAYFKSRAPVPVAGHTAILVDDGIATGATMRVAVSALRAAGAAAIWVAVPVAPREMVGLLAMEADRVICLETPEPFWAVGAHYRDFGQVEDAEVIRLLEEFDDAGGAGD